jgi:hypothetical protein
VGQVQQQVASESSAECSQAEEILKAHWPDIMFNIVQQGDPT